LVGDSNNVAQEVTVTGEAVLSNKGVLTLNNSAVISKTLTGYTRSSGPILASNTILQAIQKLDGNQRTQVFTNVTDNYTVLLSDYTLLCDTEAKSFTLSLPVAANCAGKMYIITKIDDSYNELNFNPPIQLSKINSISKLNYSKFFKIQSDGIVWQIIQY
jgi:CMP-N-acetylneuraminic acid synthetase